MKIGFEQEFFVTDQQHAKLIVPVPDCFKNPDSSGVLIEARGEAHSDVTEAIFSLQADVQRLQTVCDANGFDMVRQPVAVISKQQRLALSRKFSKGISKFENLYGYTSHRNKQSEWTAGLHISFTKPTTLYIERTSAEYNAMWDFPALFRKLDGYFKIEMLSAKRNPGFYELKPDGRVEYRSLPNTVGYLKLIKVLSEILNSR